MRRILLAFVLSAAAAAAQAEPMTREQVDTLPTKQVEANLPDAHPVAYFAYAVRLSKDKKLDAAVQWYYVGQIRYQAHLLAHPDLPAEEAVQLETINKGFGQSVIDYSGGNVRIWVQTIDKALSWDKANANNFTSKETFAAQYEQARAEVTKTRDTIKRNEAQIKAERASKGLMDR